MSDPDEVMAGIGRGIELQMAGDHAAAQKLFVELWDRIGASGDALHRCGLAHFMADVQDDVEAELWWDLRALEAAGELTDERVAGAGIAGTAAGFYPSLHLNLGEAYRKLGQRELALEHVRQSKASLIALDANGYAEQISTGLDRIAAKLDAES